jgi:hypothetical protein
VSPEREKAGRDADAACSRIVRELDDLTIGAMDGTVAAVVSAIDDLIDARIRMALADALTALQRTTP